MHRPFILAAATVAALGLAAPAAQAAFPGQNGPILYGNSYEDGAGIFSITPGGAPSLLIGTGDIGTPDGADTTADGKRIAYNRADFSIWVAGADGTGSTKLTPEGVEDFAPSWSPDGSRMVFGSTPDWETEDFSLWTMKADGTDRRQLLDDEGEPIYAIHPAWSPDGETIAFTEFGYVARGAYSWISITDAAGGAGVEPLVPGAHPEWTPDGRAIVYVDGYYGMGELRRYDLDGDDDEQLTSDEDDVVYTAPSVSPDGTTIAAEFAREEPRRGASISSGIATIDANGGEATILDGTRGGASAEWSAAAPKPQAQQPEPQAQPQILPPLPQQQAASVRAAAPVKSRVCGSRRFFSINVRGTRLKRVRVVVNGKRVSAKRNGRGYRATVDLRKLPKGRFTVKIRKTLKSGRTVTETRRYRTCVPKRLS